MLEIMEEDQLSTVAASKLHFGLKQAGFALASLAAATGIVKLVQILKQKLQTIQEDDKQCLQDNIQLDQLEILTQSPNVNLRRSAEQLLLERVMKNVNVLDDLLKWCLCRDEIEVTKAATVLCVLVKSVDIRNHPWERPYILTLAEMLDRSLDPDRHYWTRSGDETSVLKIQRLCTCALFEMICDGVAQKQFLATNFPDIIPCILKLSLSTRCKEVGRYGLFMVHQFAIQDMTKMKLIEAGGIKIISQTVVQNQGDPMLQRLSLQILAIFSNMQETESRRVLQTMSDEGVIVPTVVCLKSEDPECAYWAVALLHEFAINDVCKEEICDVYGLLRSLSQCLVASEANQQRLVLRLICFLCLKNDPFKSEVLKNKELLTRLPVCFASGDKEVVHWSLVLTHDLAIIGKVATNTMLSSCPDIITGLVSQAQHSDTVIKRLLAETIGFFTSNEHHMLKLVEGGVLKLVLQFASQGDSELKFWSAAMLLNMAMTSDEVKLEILKHGGLSVIIHQAIGEHDNTQIAVMSAKTLAMLGFIDKPLVISAVCNKEECRVKIHSDVYHINKPGLNILMWNPVTSSLYDQLHFKVNNPWEFTDLDIKVPHKPKDEGNIVIMVIKGNQGQGYLRALKNLLFFSENSKIPLEGRFDLEDQQVCVLVTNLMAKGLLDVYYMEKNKSINTEVQFPYYQIVDHCVTDSIVHPVIKLLFSTAPDSPISKVAELELLEILSRHPGHRATMLNSEGFIDYLGNIISHFISKMTTDLDYPPIYSAHCLGVLRVLAVIASHDKGQELLLKKGIVLQLVMLLFHLTGLWINSVLDIASQLQQGAVQTGDPSVDNAADLDTDFGYQKPFDDDFDEDDDLAESLKTLRKIARGEDVPGLDVDDFLGLESGFTGSGDARAVDLGPQEEPLSSQQENPFRDGGGDFPRNISDLGESFTEMTSQLASHLAANRPEMQRADDQPTEDSDPYQFQLNEQGHLLRRETSDMQSSKLASSLRREPSDLQVLSSTPLKLKRQTSKVQENEEMFSSLARFAIVALANCATPVNPKAAPAYSIAMLQTGVAHVVWSSLFCAGGVLKNLIALPVTSTIARLCSTPLLADSEHIGIHLNSEGKTSSLQLSADQLEIRNDSWTFESIKATQGINNSCFEENGPQGYFYEVTLKSNSIMQIGWANDLCQFHPEKGLGVGDDKHSFAFDGGRCKKWNGPVTDLQDNDYGHEWRDGDIVTCLFHKDGQLSYWINGEDQGVAFKDLDLTVTWYPAVSLSTDQQLRFHFGDSGFKYHAPDGFAPISELGEKRKMTVEHPLPQHRMRDFLLQLDEKTQHPQPSIYYEVTLNANTPRPFILGLTSMLDWKVPPQQVGSVVLDDILELPSGMHLMLESMDFPLTVGCGLVLPSGSVFFTVNGRPIKQQFMFPLEELGQDPLLPFLSTLNVEVNFGDTYYFYDIANERENRLSMAALLHDYHEMRCNTSISNK